MLYEWISLIQKYPFLSSLSILGLRTRCFISNRILFKLPGSLWILNYLLHLVELKLNDFFPLLFLDLQNIYCAFNFFLSFTGHGAQFRVMFAYFFADSLFKSSDFFSDFFDWTLYFFILHFFVLKFSKFLFNFLL